MNTAIATFGLGGPEIFILVFLAALYFIPAIVASIKKHPYSTGVFLLNLFLGWTVLGWIGALIWSVCVKKEAKA